jgi:glucose/arabinose dehydrogenase
MKKLYLQIIILAAVLIGYFVFQSRITSILKPRAETNTPMASEITSDTADDVPVESIIAEGLDTPWGIAFLPNNDLLVTERGGTVKLINAANNYATTEVGRIVNAREVGEGGLLGIALHPDFTKNKYIYFYYTYESQGNNTLNRVVRMTYENNRLSNEQVIIDRIPGAGNHNGGRIKFGPDKMLYIATGDAQEPSLAQDRNSLAGKILRVTDKGEGVAGNLFNNLAYSYGHRNTQGITWDTEGNLWQTEHGRSAPTGFDEINLIRSGKNYGWPDIQGSETKSGMETPVKNSGPSTVWAPGSAAFIKNSLFFSGLRGQSLYEAVIQDGQVIEFKEHLKGKYGRLREAVAGPDGMLYITTSNKDGRGSPEAGDDKIIRINPEKLN